MRIVDPEVKLIKQIDLSSKLDKDSTIEDISKIQNELFQNILNHIEYCNKICRDISVEETIKNSNNLDILEHGTVYLTIPVSKPDPENTEDYMRRMKIVNFYQHNPESVVKGFKSDEDDVLYVYFITTNYRIIIENNRHTDLVFLFNNSEYHAQRFTYGIVTNKYIAHKLLKNKYLSVTISDPVIVNNEIVLSSHSFDDNPVAKNSMINLAKESYKLYESLVDSGVSKEISSKVLPDTVQMNIVLSGFKEDFENLFKTIELESDVDYTDILHMMMYDSDNSEINEELVNEVVEENIEESRKMEEGATTEGDSSISE